MKAFGTKYPILFEILLFIAAMLLSIAFGLPGMILYFPVEISNAIGRILCGIVLFFVFRYCFAENRPGAGIPFAAFGLILVLWNLLNSLVFTAGAQMNDVVRAVLLGLAPAVWEEIIFRGIFIYNLEKSGKSEWATLLISAVFFGIVHLTNAVGGSFLNVLIQTGYAIVIGMLFGAIYIRSRDILSVILLHAMIDISSNLFTGGQSAITPTVLAVFIGTLVLAAAYAVWLMRGAGTKSEANAK